MIKEYGGCLPLELNKLNIDMFPGFESVALNSGRSAIAYAVLAGKFDKVYIPYYTCKTVEDGLFAGTNAEVEYYNIDEYFMPIEPEGGFDDRALFVYTNYFGIMTHAMQTDILSEHSHVLFDNTQGFFTAPARGAYNAYSCRKFFGVADGAYLVADSLPQLDLRVGESATTAGFLLKAIEDGSNAAYDLSKENEEHINAEGLRRMSPLTSALMSTVNLSSVKERRNANFNRMHELLGGINELTQLIDMNDKNNIAPMVYPLLVETDGLREALVENKIFVPRWWRWIAESLNTNAFEKHLSYHLVALPITQNYTVDDMEVISDTVKNLYAKLNM